MYMITNTQIIACRIESLAHNHRREVPELCIINEYTQICFKIRLTLKSWYLILEVAISFKGSGIPAPLSESFKRELRDILFCK
jgi:hypothetical protein